MSTVLTTLRIGRSARIVLVLVLGLVLRIFRLGAWEIGLDEAYSAKAAALSLGKLLPIIAKDDSHPPFYYFLLHLWWQVGTSELWLRLLSVGFGIAAIWVVYRLASSAADERAGLITAFIVAVSPLHIFCSQQARMYSILFFLSSASLHLFWRILHGATRRVWVAYVVVTLAAIYTHYAAFLILGAENLAVIVLVLIRERFPIRYWLAAQSLILLGFAPWASMLVRDATNTTPAATVRFALEQAAFAFSGLISYLLPLNTPFLKAAAIGIYGTAALVGVIMVREKKASIMLVCSSVALLALAALIGWRFAAAAATSIIIPRTLIVASAGLYVAIATTIARARPRFIGGTLLAGLVALNLLSYPQLYYRVERSGPWREVAQYVASGLDPHDGVVFVSGFWARAFDYYFIRYIPAAPYIRYGSTNDLQRVSELADASNRIWLILKQPHAIDPYDRVGAFLRAWGAAEQDRTFTYGIRILVYERR